MSHFYSTTLILRVKSPAVEGSLQTPHWPLCIVTHYATITVKYLPRHNCNDCRLDYTGTIALCACPSDNRSASNFSILIKDTLVMLCVCVCASMQRTHVIIRKRAHVHIVGTIYNINSETMFSIKMKSFDTTVSAVGFFKCCTPVCAFCLLFNTHSGTDTPTLSDGRALNYLLSFNKCARAP